jgi:hypothetical protein
VLAEAALGIHAYDIKDQDSQSKPDSDNEQQLDPIDNAIRRSPINISPIQGSSTSHVCDKDTTSNYDTSRRKQCPAIKARNPTGHYDIGIPPDEVKCSTTMNRTTQRWQRAWGPRSTRWTRSTRRCASTGATAADCTGR